MKVSCKFLLLPLLLLTVVSLSAQTGVVPPNAAQAYQKALGNLHWAKDYMQQLGPTGHIDEQEQHAIAEMETAINEIKAAGITVPGHPAIARDLTTADRYTKAMSLTQEAYSFILQNPSTNTKRDDDVKVHIKAAAETIRVIRNELKQ